MFLLNVTWNVCPVPSVPLVSLLERLRNMLLSVKGVIRGLKKLQIIR